MGLQERPYQTRVPTEVQLNKKNIVVSSIQSGKSYMMYLIKEALFKYDKILVVNGTRNIIKQLQNYFEDSSLILGGEDFDHTKAVHIASYQSLNNRNIDLSQYSCLYLEEVHLRLQTKQVKNLITQIPTTIGFTGSPLTAANKLLPGFDNWITGATVNEMMQNNWLASTRFFMNSSMLSDNAAALKTNKSEYDSEVVNQLIDKNHLLDEMKKQIVAKKLSTEHKTLLYVDFIKTVDKLAEMLVDTPNVYTIHSKFTQKQQDKTLSDFKEASVGILINVRTVSVGVSISDVDRVMLAVFSKIHSNVLQMCLRGSTLNKDKPDAITEVYDMTGVLANVNPYTDFSEYGEHKPSCMEQAKLIDDPEQRYYAMLACTPEPVVTVCDGRLPSSYVGNPYVINYEVTTPNIKPCGEVMSIHDMKYATTESKSNRGIIYKWTRCKCGFTSKVVLKCMSTPSDLVLVYDEQLSKPTNKVLAIYSKEHNKCLLVIDDPKLVTYKFKFAGTQAEIFDICKDVLKDKPFTLSSNIPLPKLPNSHVNKSLGNVVDLINWDDESKNTSMVRKLCKAQLFTLTKQFGYSKHYVYYYMKVVMSSNLKELVKLLESNPSKSAVNRFKLKYEEQMGLNKPKAPAPTTDLSSIDFDMGSEIPF